MKLFNHVQIKVKDLSKSRVFFDKIMTALGYKIVLELKNEVIGYGTSTHDMFEIRQFDNNYHLSQSVHIAFNAKCIEEVNLFYDTAIANGAKCNGRPGFRTEYEEGYYSAFVVEPNGHNIEAVYSAKGTV